MAAAPLTAHTHPCFFQTGLLYAPRHPDGTSTSGSTMLRQQVSQPLQHLGAAGRGSTHAVVDAECKRVIDGLVQPLPRPCSGVACYWDLRCRNIKEWIGDFQPAEHRGSMRRGGYCAVERTHQTHMVCMRLGVSAHTPLHPRAPAQIIKNCSAHL